MAMSAEADDFDVLVDNLNDDYLLALSLQSLEDEFNSYENKTRKTVIESDYELAVRLSQTDDQLVDDKKSVMKPNAKDIVSPELELLDPNPNIWHLMSDFDRMYFNGVLAKHCIELSWSSRMTRCAGLCAWSPTTHFCSIRLSLPLLQLRSRKDLVETLIHEMIHALLFVTREDDNHESHGKKFHEHMDRINRESGASITVYHNFTDEVNHFLKHVWRCEGQCRTRAPYFGYVRRSMNRKPGPNDYWFKFHESSCGGKFLKVAEPSKEELLNKNKTNGKKVPTPTPERLKNKDIRSYINSTKTKATNSNSETIPFSGFGHKLGSNEPNNSTTNEVKYVWNPYSNGFVVNTKNVIKNKAISAQKLDNWNNCNENEGKSEPNVTSIPSSFTYSINFESFKGKGNVLGRGGGIVRIQTNGQSTNANPLRRTQESVPKELIVNKMSKKEDIECIQID